MNKNRTLKKSEVVEVTAKLLGLLKHLYIEYVDAKRYVIPEIKIGDWAIERSYLGQFPIESILRIDLIDQDKGMYEGVDLLGEKRTWSNASFVPLPEHCQDYLNGKYRW